MQAPLLCRAGLQHPSYSAWYACDICVTLLSRGALTLWAQAQGHIASAYLDHWHQWSNCRTHLFLKIRKLGILSPNIGFLRSLSPFSRNSRLAMTLSSLDLAARNTHWWYSRGRGSIPTSPWISFVQCSPLHLVGAEWMFLEKIKWILWSLFVDFFFHDLDFFFKTPIEIHQSFIDGDKSYLEFFFLSVCYLIFPMMPTLFFLFWCIGKLWYRAIKQLLQGHRASDLSPVGLT